MCSYLSSERLQTGLSLGYVPGEDIRDYIIGVKYKSIVFFTTRQRRA